MKKIIYALIIPLLFITRVNAAVTPSYYISNFYNSYSIYNSVSSTIIDNLVEYWETNYSNDKPYYVISYSDTTLNGRPMLILSPFSSPDFYYLTSYNEFHNPTITTDSYVYYFDTGTYASAWFNRFIPTSYLFYFSNTDIYNSLSPSSDYGVSTLQLPSYSNLDYDVSFPQYNIEVGDTIPTYMSLTNGQPSADFTEVDMSQYEYIILSLRNYDTTTFNTTIYSLGRLCFTPVYNYGMTPKKDYVNGYQTQGCTENYSSLTPVPIYIIQADLNNHAVYYIKRYENETNILQIPTSIFDITYITSQNANNPQVSIGGRSYPAIPYSQLTDTANISTDEGYVSGQVCAVGDVNCVAEVSGIPIDDLFSNPLHLLQTVWTSILSVFNVIGSFISILPPTLQAFLYTSFMLGIILGILKILL